MMATHRIELPLRVPLQTGAGPVTVRRGVVVVSHEAGTIAVAEATPHPDLSPTDPEQLYQTIGATAAEGPPEREVIEAWLAADHDARAAGVPVAARLSVNPSGRVEVNGLLGRDDGPAIARLLTRSHRTLKVKVGPDPERAAGRIAGIREAVGEDVVIRVDANGAWSLAAVGVALEAMAPLGVEYVEDPMHPDDDWTLLRDSPVPLAVDLAAPTEAQLDVVDVVVLKPSMATPSASLEAAARARAHGADVVVTSIVDGAIGIGAALNVAAALGVQRACGLATSSLLAMDVGDPPPIRDGTMELNRPGVGVVVDAERLSQVTVDAFGNRSND